MEYKICKCGHERKHHAKVKGKCVGTCLVSVIFDGIFTKDKEEYCKCQEFKPSDKENNEKRH